MWYGEILKKVRVHRSFKRANMFQRKSILNNKFALENISSLTVEVLQSEEKLKGGVKGGVEG